MASLHPNTDRIWADIMALAEITEPDRPYTRRSFTPRFEQGRDWVRHRFEQAGLRCRLDTGANLIGRRAGQIAPVLLLGSHSDSVPDGGRFDGMAGLIAALEVARVLGDAGHELRHTLEIVDFLAEEPSDFGLSCIGSRTMAGRLTADHLALPGPGGELLGAAIDRMGGDVARLADAQRRDIAAFLELHIEQGIVLESDALAIGVVQAIAGITRVEIVFTGRADHAGTTPMTRRQDAAVAAARVIAWVSDQANHLAASGQGHVTATVGVVEIQPNASNVVPRGARLVVDLRVSQRDVAEDFVPALRVAAENAASQTRVTLTRCDLLSDTQPVPCDAGLQKLLIQASADRNLPHTNLVSGAGHDAAIIAAVAPSAMVFIPCRDGRSHDPAEWAEPQAIADGAAVMLDAVLARDAE